jgi:hypothetical protein
MEFWRVDAPKSANGTRRQIGVVFSGADKAGTDAATEGWPKDLTRHLGLDELLALEGVADGIRARAFGAPAGAELVTTLEVRRVAGRMWRRVNGKGVSLRLRVNGKLTDVSGRLEPARQGKLYDPSQLRTLVAEKNAQVLPSLVRSLRSTMGVIPFVGAGMSAPFRFPQWGSLLEQLAKPHQRDQITRLVASGEFERAAQILHEKGRAADRLQEAIQQTFGRSIPKHEIEKSAVAFLPYITAGPVITTNYDRVLESAFDFAGCGFKRILLGSDPDEIVPAIQRNERVLFKIHGDCETRRALTLTFSSYENAYRGAGGRAAREKLEGMLPVLVMNRPLLFLGCSLGTDRTLQVVREVHDKHASIGHYAILAADYDMEAFQRRVDEMVNLGIRVLWYLPGEFVEIGRLLRELLDAVSMEDLEVSEVAASSREPNRSMTPSEPAASIGPTPPLPVALQSRIQQGRVIYFLGAGASGPLQGDPFYDAISKLHGAPPLARSRVDIAQFIIDSEARDVRDRRDALVGAVVQVLREHFPTPSDIHRRMAALPEPANGSRTIIMTTNYDCGLETAFEGVRRKHHLFVYQAHGKHAGRFIHRSPDGKLRVILAPENILDLSDGHPLIVKMNGGPRLNPMLDDTFAVGTRDFYGLAAQIPAVFPMNLRREIEARSLLFLAHGLREPDVEELVRYRRGREERSWAVQWNPKYQGPDEGSVRYWKQVGLDILWGDVRALLPAIENALA